MQVVQKFETKNHFYVFSFVHLSTKNLFCFYEIFNFDNIILLLSYHQFKKLKEAINDLTPLLMPNCKTLGNTNNPLWKNCKSLLKQK